MGEAKKETEVEQVSEYRQELIELREILLANVVMAAEIPSPTFHEEGVVKFLFNRFNEAGLNNVSIDEAGNATGFIPGTVGERNILVAAHVDKIWEKKEDHTISVSADSMQGRGVADNSLGVAVLATLPIILEKLDIELESNLILLGNTCSFGRGDLAGMRFFLENTKVGIDSALCLEGTQLGRLSYSSMGMARGEIEVSVGEEPDVLQMDRSSAIGSLNKIINSILAIERPEKPRTAILLGSVEAGSGYNVPPTTGRLRFEIRSESADVVARVQGEIQDIVEECRAMDQCEASLAILAQRSPGDIGFDHPLVRKARETLSELGIKTKIAPSVSELSALLDKKIPALTLGLTKGDNRHAKNESILIEPVFDGLAQLVSLLKFMDSSFDPTDEK